MLLKIKWKKSKQIKFYKDNNTFKKSNRREYKIKN